MIEYCEFNPSVACSQIPDVNSWCNVIWGYCQFHTTESKRGCPIRNLHLNWLEYWILAQAAVDGEKKILAKIGDYTKEYTINEIKKIYKSSKIIRINIVYDSSGDVDPEELLELAIVTGNLTIYCEDKLISIGRNAFKDELSLERIDLDSCLYIGTQAFLGCDNLKTISFESKSDRYIPILENINSLYMSNGEVNPDLSVLVPSELYSKWTESTNWVALSANIYPV